MIRQSQTIFPTETWDIQWVFFFIEDPHGGLSDRPILLHPRHLIRFAHARHEQFPQLGKGGGAEEKNASKKPFLFFINLPSTIFQGEREKKALA